MQFAYNQTTYSVKKVKTQGDKPRYNLYISAHNRVIAQSAADVAAKTPDIIAKCIEAINALPVDGSEIDEQPDTDKTTKTLRDKISDLLFDHADDDIIEALIKEKDYCLSEYAQDAIISHITMFGKIVVKPTGLADKMRVEEALLQIYPYSNQEGFNLWQLYTYSTQL